MSHHHRRAVIRPVGAPVTRWRRLLVGAVGALGASGLVLGGVGVPVSAGDVNATGNPHVSVEQDGDCVTAAADAGAVDGSVVPEQGGDAAGLEAEGQGSATAFVCRDDVDGPPPADPGGSLRDDLEGFVSGTLEDVESVDVDDVVPGEPGAPGGSLEGEVTAVVTAALDSAGGEDGDLLGALGEMVPDGGGFPGDPGDLPGDPGDLPGDPGDLPGDPGALVPDVSGVDAGDLFDRLGQIIPGAIGGSGPGGGGNPGGNGGGAPTVNTSTNGSGSAAVGGVGAERGEPTEAVPAPEVGGGDDGPALVGTSLSPGATLPRTGGGLGNGVLRLVAVLGLGRALVGLAKRR